jgi:hypothetical protein
LGLPSKKKYSRLILVSAGLAYRQGLIEDMQELSCAGGRNRRLSTQLEDVRRK